MKAKTLAYWLLDNCPEKEILIACDEEGNAYGNIDPANGSYAVSEKNIVLYPIDTILSEDL